MNPARKEALLASKRAALQPALSRRVTRAYAHCAWTTTAEGPMDTRFASPIRVSDPVRWRRAAPRACSPARTTSPIGTGGLADGSLACRGSQEFQCAPELI